MSGSEAIVLLKHNKSIRRKSWPPKWYVRLSSTGPELSNEMEEMIDVVQNEENTLCTWAMKDLFRDLLFDDWEIVE